LSIFSGSSGPGTNGNLSVGSLVEAISFWVQNSLTVGSNNLTKTVSAVISDCGFGACQVIGATGGSLIKVSTGTLTLSGADIYGGGTTISSSVGEQPRQKVSNPIRPNCQNH
jgi:autotransporter-associated beta strand protein